MGKKRKRNTTTKEANELIKIKTLNEAKDLINSAIDLIKTAFFINQSLNASSSATTSVDPEQSFTDATLAILRAIADQLSSEPQEITIPNRLQVLREIRDNLESAKNLVKSVYHDADDDNESNSDTELEAALAAGEDAELVYQDEIIGNLNEIVERITNIGNNSACEYPDEIAAGTAVSSSDVVAFSSKTSSSTAAAASSNLKPNVDLSKIKYAPVPKPLTGQYSIGAAVLGWSDRKMPPNSASGMVNDINKTYMDLSGGRFGFNNRDAKVVRLRYKFARKNLNKAEAQAQREIGRHDLNAFIHGGARKYSNSGRDQMHLINARAGKHESGHVLDALQNGKSLGHATSSLGKDNSDNYSFMGFGAAVPRLTLPQLYNQGWPSQSKSLPAEKAVAQHELGSAPTDYPFENLYAEEHEDGCVRGVRVVRPNGREVFVSYLSAKDDENKGELVFFAHYRTGGGSQLFARFNDKQIQLDENLYAKNVGLYGDGKPVLRFSSTPITAESSSNSITGSQPTPNKKKRKHA